METTAQAVEARVEASHWWFRGRRQLVAATIRDLAVPADARVLDVGSGTGSNLRMLRELGFGHVTGLDRSGAAARHCREKGLGTAPQGDVCALPFRDACFDLVLATDVLEHVPDDAAAVAELHRVLRPGGTLIATVPAFRSLWGLQDDVSHHLRRYRRAQVVGRLREGGFEVARSFYFNYLLFAPIWLARQALRALRVQLESENQVNTPVLNAVLGGIFAFDVRSAPRLRPPFGVSILATGRRTAAV